MPAGNTALHERALIRAQARESIALGWNGAPAFPATKNPPRLKRDGVDTRVDANNGDNTACELTAVFSVLPADLATLVAASTAQSESFTDEAGRTYRVAMIDYTPGLPAVVFHISNVVDLS